jgi:hypothetical protein
MAKQKEPKKDRTTLSLFILLVPSLLLAMTSAIAGTWVRIFFQVVLILFQTVMLNNMLKDLYGGDEESEAEE